MQRVRFPRAFCLGGVFPFKSKMKWEQGLKGRRSEAPCWLKGRWLLCSLLLPPFLLPQGVRCVVFWAVMELRCPWWHPKQHQVWVPSPDIKKNFLFWTALTRKSSKEPAMPLHLLLQTQKTPTVAESPAVLEKAGKLVQEHLCLLGKERMNPASAASK